MGCGYFGGSSPLIPNFKQSIKRSLSLDIYEHLQEYAIPLIKKFIEEDKKDESYDVLESFKTLIVNLPEEVHRTIINSIADECCDTSDKIAEIFGLLFPDYQIQKISFLDSSQRKNFIDYEADECLQ